MIILVKVIQAWISYLSCQKNMNHHVENILKMGWNLHLGSVNNYHITQNQEHSCCRKFQSLGYHLLLLLQSICIHVI